MGTKPEFESLFRDTLAGLCVCTQGESAYHNQKGRRSVEGMAQHPSRRESNGAPIEVLVKYFWSFAKFLVPLESQIPLRHALFQDIAQAMLLLLRKIWCLQSVPHKES